MFVKNKLIVFAMLVFIKICIADAAMVEVETSINDKIRATLQYALMHHNKIIVNCRLPEFRYLYSEDWLPTIILRNAKIIVEQKAFANGWQNVINSVNR